MSLRVAGVIDAMDIDVASATMSAATATEVEAEGGRGVKRRRVSIPTTSSASSSVGGCNDVDMDCDSSSEGATVLGAEPPSKKCRAMNGCTSSAAGSIGSIGSGVEGQSASVVTFPTKCAVQRRVSYYAEDTVEVDMEQDTLVSIPSDLETPRQLGYSSNVVDLLPSTSVRASPIPLSMSVVEQSALGLNHNAHKRAIITPSSSFLLGAKGCSIIDTIPLRDVATDTELVIPSTGTCGERSASVESLPPVAGNPATKPSNAHTRGNFQFTHDAAQPKKKISSGISKFLFFLAALVFLEASLLVADKVFDLPFDPSFSLMKPVHANSVYVPGAGFSGFWFTLGRLKSIPNPADKNYYCYSAGCLGVVATLSNRTMQEMADLALGVQRMWKDGTIDRFDVTSRFVDGLLLMGDDGDFGGDENITMGGGDIDSLPMNDADLLSKINVVTTAKKTIGINHVIRSPKNILELKEMLLQTTWIPFATGEGLWSKDLQTGTHHMDGAFSATMHPKCTYHLGLPLMMDLFMNVLNVNLGLDKVEKYWNAGVEWGV